ncbi:Rv3235 family protein [Arthrobacter sp. Ld5]|uniref:Rv3235 family protein n=1 Tax=Arthrobacter sp. Ld5 TaxID=649152 RepID=UPI003EBCB09A
MNAVTQLRPPAQLAEASGAPRPLLASTPRPSEAPAAVIPLRSAEPDHGPAPAAGPVQDGSATGGTDPEVERRIAGIARSVCQGALEVLGGSRPLQQMSRWLDAESYERLQLRTNLVRCVGARGAGHGGNDAHGAGSAHRHVVVRSARVCPISPAVYEASVVAVDRKRVRAVALRIEQRRGTWRVTALEIG